METAAAHEYDRLVREVEEDGELRRGPWTVEEDLLLVNYIAAHGEGRWNALARCAGLKRTGKSCRLRWLNYLRPDLRRGSMTAQEQVLILELHARWGNRWSKIAQHLPGRTDNEIKNYWRTRVQKHARHLNCDVNSQQFKDLMRYLWMPRLLERINSTDADLSSSSCTTAVSSSSSDAGGPQPVVSPPPPPAGSGGSYYGATATMCDTVCQPTPPPPPQSSSCLTSAHHQHQPPVSQLGADACSWSDNDQSSLPGLAGGQWYAGDMGFPDMDMDMDIGGLGLGDTIWGAGDDLWYTQMLGL